AAAHEDVPEIFHDEEDPTVHFTEEDLVEARERAELSLLARIFWEEPRELRAVENSFIQVWNCGRVRIFDVVGRKLLANLGEVVKVGYYDAGTPEGCYIKGRVRMNLLGSFLGTAPVTGVNGSSSPAFFQYIGVPCICYLCGWLGHVMADCPRTDLAFDEDVRSDWICSQADKNEKESQASTSPVCSPTASSKTWRSAAFNCS
ncbi:hypothetical protein LINPERPRIM_LOCUS37304, partial [Linum perenne]